MILSGITAALHITAAWTDQVKQSIVVQPVLSAAWAKIARVEDFRRLFHFKKMDFLLSHTHLDAQTAKRFQKKENGQPEEMRFLSLLAGHSLVG